MFSSELIVKGDLIYGSKKLFANINKIVVAACTKHTKESMMWQKLLVTLLVTKLVTNKRKKHK